jgi:DNA polymerase-3 subunit epsilon
MDGCIAVALDFETADQGADSACALGMVRIRGTAVEASWYSLIRPPRRRFRFTAIHGITWAMVKDCPSFAEIWPECEAFLAGARYLVAHNAAFDRHILFGCCESAGVTPPAVPFLCTVKGARRGLKLPRNRLSDVCRHLDIDLEHHNAASDAMAAARIYLHLSANGIAPAAMRIG